MSSFKDTTNRGRLLITFLFRVSRVLLVNITSQDRSRHIKTSSTFRPLRLTKFQSTHFRGHRLLIALRRRRQGQRTRLQVMTLQQAMVFRTFKRLLNSPLLSSNLTIQTNSTSRHAPRLHPIVNHRPLGNFSNIIRLRRATLPNTQKNFSTPLSRRHAGTPTLRINSRVVQVIIHTTRNSRRQTAPRLTQGQATINGSQPRLKVTTQGLSTTGNNGA